MIPDAKRKRVDECIEDRISDLPTHLIDDILDRRPVRDGARTTHVGPVKTFSLRIPAPLNLGDTPYPCLWIKQLPEKRVKVLDLRNRRPNRTINMPSYFFSCSDLNWLYLDNWKLLNPPHKFRGFPNLAKITLCFVAFTTKMSFGTQVQHFELRCCTGIEHLDIQLTNHGKNIKYLNIERSVNMEKRRARDYNPLTDMKKSFNLRRLLGNMSSIRTLQVDPISLSGPDRNCGRNVKLTAEQYLESPDCADVTLNQLRKVSMQNILGSRAELLLIKLLLASSPSLRRMELKHSTKVDDSREYLRIEGESLQFPRKSPVVKISWRSKLSHRD
ncbi:hypothetical protein POM88_051329 [Heracleum sosnowskyi]|uniref:F-box/LRR-repeat protein 15/At3g58940/PEG3-like LRR domain-containing protein n=1 Tax=Heracleum sosnowskyi TaxID=360622 RepID=A0AAD8H0E9_9APIA|nr:hypothetical protein POM88_051329 [Heracleum sosnowskyi]